MAHVYDEFHASELAESARVLFKCDAAGWTDKTIVAALDVSAGNVGRWHR